MKYTKGTKTISAKTSMYHPFLSTIVQQSTILQFKNKYKESGKEKKVKSAGVSTHIQENQNINILEHSDFISNM